MSCESIKSLCYKLWLVLLVFCALCVWPIGRTRAEYKNFTITINVIDERGPVNDAVVNIIRDRSTFRLVRDGEGHYSGTEVTLDTTNDYAYTVEARDHSTEKRSLTSALLITALQNENKIELPDVQLKSTSGKGDPANHNGIQQANPNAQQTTGNLTSHQASAPGSAINNGQNGNNVGTALSLSMWLIALPSLLSIFTLAGLAYLSWKARSLPLSARTDGTALDNTGGATNNNSLYRIIQTMDYLKSQQEDMIIRQRELLRLVGLIPTSPQTPDKKQTEGDTRAQGQGRNEQGNTWPASEAQSGLSLNAPSTPPLDVQAQDEPGQTAARRSSPVPEEVQKSYENLVQRLTVSPDPIYLNAEAKTSMTEVYEDSNVYLREVTTTQGAFVLFTGFNQQSWVFPNPHMPYRQQALKPVFPELKEAEFTSSKHVVPKQVSPLDGGRWKVVTGQ